MSTLRNRFGKRLRYIRRHKDLTQEQLAEAVGISIEFLSNLERGVNAPSFETLEKLALGVFMVRDKRWICLRCASLR